MLHLLIALTACTDDAPPEDSSTDSTPQETGDSVVDTQPQGDPAVLSNVPDPCNPRVNVGAADAQDGWWMTTRLGPVTAAYEVTDLSYTLITPRGDDNDLGCSIMDHRVRVFVDGGSPDASPTLVEELTVADLAAGAGISVEVPLTLTTPATLQSGESLYVMVEGLVGEPGMGGVAPRVCLLACNDAEVFDASRNLWSGALEPPYAWVTGQDLGGEYSFSVSAMGGPQG